MTTRVVRGNQQRIIPDVSVDAYRRRGWSVRDEPEPPAASDVKAVWVDHAESLGIDVSGMTKADIIAAVEAH